MFEREIETIYEATFFDLESSRLHIELWDLEGFYLNQFIAYNSIPLVEIIDGPLQHQVEMFPYIENFQTGKLVARLDLKINLAEIWDFTLDFIDWKTTNLANTMKPGQVNPQLTIKMSAKGAIRNQVVSPSLQNNKFPYWQRVSSEQIVYRGTYHELKQEEITITLQSKQTLGYSIIG